jgi:phage terminase large subunit-like protein
VTDVSGERTPRKRRPPPKTKPVARTTTRETRDRARRVCEFIEKFVIVPEGTLIGQPMKLLPMQRQFIQDVYGRLKPDGRLLTRRGILSEPRKNGKTGLISALSLAHIAGPEAKANSGTYSAARSRDQASQVFNYSVKSINMSPRLRALTKIMPSVKEIHGLALNVVYKAVSADAKTKMGLAPALTIHDELGQVVGPTDALYDAMETAGGAYSEPLSLIISTQAATSADLLSIIIDDALRSDDPSTVCHLFAADEENGDDIWDEEVWKRVNPAWGIFRDIDDFRDLARRAKRMPTSEATFRNLYLNMRTARESLAIAPTTWKENDGTPDESAFYKYPVSIGIDLSGRIDLTAAVIAVTDDDGIVHLKVLAFTPAQGLEERSKTDRVPYELYVKQGNLIAVPGRVIDYEVAAEMLRDATEGMDVEKVAFDRWRIDLFKKHADNIGFAPDAVWQCVGQGFKDMSPRLENFISRLLNKTIRHGSHPILNMGAAGAIAVKDAANNQKLEKTKSTARIDALVAAVMGVGAVDGLEVTDDDGPGDAGENSLFFVGHS